MYDVKIEIPLQNQRTGEDETCTVMILSFRTDMPWQTVQTQIRSSLIRVYTVCHSICIVWTHYSMVEPLSSNFRVITKKKFWVSKYLVNLRYKRISDWGWGGPNYDPVLTFDLFTDRSNLLYGENMPSFSDKTCTI